MLVNSASLEKLLHNTARPVIKKKIYNMLIVLSMIPVFNIVTHLLISYKLSIYLGGGG